MIDTLLSGVGQGIFWAVLALGVYISFRLLDFADLTCEGSITLGASVAAMLIWKGVNPFLAAFISFFAGMLAGTLTGVLHTKLRIPPILSGILTMISLYSINIHIMSLATGSEGTANLSLLKFSDGTVQKIVASFLGIPKNLASIVLGAVIVAALIALLYWFFGTELGCSVRATGANEKMCRAEGIDTDFMKIIGLALSNGLIALAGALICQYQGYSDVNMGVGSIVIGLASIIIGETLFSHVINFAMKMLGIAVGAIVYRIVVAVVIYSGMPATDLKLMTAVIVMAALSLPILRERTAKSGAKKKGGAAK